MIYEVRKATEAEAWTVVSAAWDPWHQEKPILRAQVNSSDGRVHQLDLKSITDRPQREYEANMFSDRRELAAPLPAIAPGSIVETETMTRDTAPYFEAGDVWRQFLSAGVPVGLRRVIVEAPKGSPVQVRTHGIPSEDASKTEVGNLVRWQIKIGPFEPDKDAPVEWMLPSDQSVLPSVAISTGTSWQRLAERYAGLFDQRVNSGLPPAWTEFVQARLAENRPRRELIDRLVRHLHEQVRYTGVELDEAALIPHTPVETAAHRYGDCKDKAAMLIALLRAAGINAYPALLNTGPGLDVDRDLPGMGRFDHVIVYVPGAEPLWIDATSEWSRVGDLPAADQGRLSLIVKPDTTDLVEIPESSSADNRITNTRTVTMRDPGPSLIHETVETTGVYDASYRSSYSDGTEAAKKRLEEYAKPEFLAEAVDKIAYHEKDFSKSFTIDFDATQAKRGMVADSDAAVVALPMSLFSDLPAPLREKLDGDTKVKDRKMPLRFDTPFVEEYHYLITPPRYFRLTEVPAPIKQAIGAGEYTAVVKQAEDGKIDLLLRFDSGRRIYTAAEVNQARNALVELKKNQVFWLRMKHEGITKIAAHKEKEGLALLRQATQEDPPSVAAHLRYAAALRQLGFGLAARAAAKRAVETDPGSALAHHTLGVLLQYDDIGQRLMGGADVEGAEKELRKAIELDPKDLASRLDLAIMLEFDKQGERYSPAARLKEAADEYKKIPEDLATERTMDNLAILQGRAGWYKDVLATIEKCTPAAKQQLGLAAAAVTEGITAALAKGNAYEATAAQRASTFSQVTVILTQWRFYPEAYEFAVAAQRLSGNTEVSPQTILLKRLRRAEDAPIDPSRPESLYAKLVQLAVSYDKSASEQITQMLPSWLSDAKSQPDLDMSKQFRPLQALFARLNLPRGFFPDVVATQSAYTVEGDEATGHRVVARLAVNDTEMGTFYVYKEDGTFRFIAAKPDLSGVGLLALQHLRNGRLAEAQKVLDWAVVDTPNGEMRPGDPILTPAFTSLWGARGTNTRTKAATESAAAALEASYSKVDLGLIPLLEKGRKAESLPELKREFDVAVITAYRKQSNWPKMREAAERLFNEVPKSGIAFEFLREALEQLCFQGFGQDRAAAVSALRKAIETRQKAGMITLRLPAGGGKSNGKDTIVARSEAFLNTLDNKWDLAAPAYLESSEEPSLEDLWAALAGGKVTTSMVDKLQGKLQKFQFGEGDRWMTLAAMQWSVGDINDSRASLTQAVNLTGLDELDEKASLILGGIAEHFGLNDEAERLLSKAAKYSGADTSLRAAAYLAKRHLEKVAPSVTPAR